jgi:hypothetical protein
MFLLLLLQCLLACCFVTVSGSAPAAVTEQPWNPGGVPAALVIPVAAVPDAAVLDVSMFIYVPASVSAAVYHVTADGWKKVRGDDVTECHFEYYPDPAAHPSAGTPVI